MMMKLTFPKKFNRNNEQQRKLKVRNPSKSVLSDHYLGVNVRDSVSGARVVITIYRYEQDV